jgi:predicted DsbA family dithiol-disulfide isomerase
MLIEIVSDLICPWCLIGKRRLDRALAQRPAIEAEIVWHPFQLNPNMPREGINREVYVAAKFGSRERAAQIYGRVSEAAAKDGIPVAFDKIKRTPSTLDGHRLVRFAARYGLATALTEALFQAYFVEGEDIGDHAVLVAKAGAIGLDGSEVAAYLASDTDVEEIRAADLAARRSGIDGVPRFVFERRYVLSGAHEPAAFLPVFDAITTERAKEAV